MDVQKRQLWNPPTITSPSQTPHCTPFTLPSNGILSLHDTVITLTTDVVFRPQCTGQSVQEVSSIQGTDPFYASTIPQTYVIAAATVISWVLVIMLLITGRTTFLGRSGPTPGFSSGHGIIGGAQGGPSNLIGVGSRPWLQKVAALTVAISLTIATADFFKAAEKQYDVGYMDAKTLRQDVLGTTEVKVTRVISDVFLWLAQVQTLVRLFPRHKEKVLIKWIGFALILFDSLFSCLNSFYTDRRGGDEDRYQKPLQFVEAIPALSYLFELALGLLYAAWVIYYALTKRRYAFYHAKMKSICLISTLSLIAILTPVVFFVTDVSNPNVAGWGDYFRWVGAAAASVVVWEWVERIEALERDEKKDGILGREIFDGDEMLDVTPSEDFVWEGSRHTRRDERRDSDGGSGAYGSSNRPSALEKGLSSVAQRFHSRQVVQQRPSPSRTASQMTSDGVGESEKSRTRNGQPAIVFGSLPSPREQNEEPVIRLATPPPVAASPVSRADTTSAASTVYVVRNGPIADMPQPVRRRAEVKSNAERTSNQAWEHRLQAADPEKEATDDEPSPNVNQPNVAWLSVPNPFKRKRASPPTVIQQARRSAGREVVRSTTPAHNFSPWDIKNRLGVLAAETGDRLRDRRAARGQEADVPVTIIPAQPRGSGRTRTSPIPNPTPNVQRGAAGNADADASRQSAPSRSDNGSPYAAGGAGNAPTPSVSRVSEGQPPSADDIRPAGGSMSPTIIPAPRRSQRSSPLALHQASAMDDVVDTNETPRDNG